MMIRSVLFFGLLETNVKAHTATYCLNDTLSLDVSMLHGWVFHLSQIRTQHKPDYVQI